MEQLNIKTSFPFPVCEMKSKVNYTEVKQASGIQYIILALIHNNSSNKDEYLFEVLKKFGVPNDLMFIFIDELSNMIQNLDIIKMVGVNYLPDYFKEYKISQFSFTEKGNNIFKDGSVPTGKELSKIVKLYYDMINHKFLVDSPVKLMNLEGTRLNEEMFDNYEFDLDLMDVIQEHKSRFSFKEQEEIISADVDEYKLMTGKYEKCLYIKIDNNELKLDFSDNNMFNLVQEYYNGEIISDEFANKNKFLFEDKIIPLKVSNIKDIENISNIYLPSQIITAPKEVPNILLSFGDYFIFKRKHNLGLSIKNNWIKKYCEGVEYATINNNEINLYLPAIVTFKEKDLKWDIDLNLILEKKLLDSETEEFFLDLYDEIKDKFSDNNLAIVSEISKDDKLLIDYIKKHIIDEEVLSEQILKFGVLNKIIENKEFKKNIANDILLKIIPEITTSNLSIYLNFIKPIQKSLELNNIDFIKKVIEKIGNVDIEELYLSITKAGYSKDDALSIANIYDKYLNDILNSNKIDVNSENELSIDCQSFNERLINLKKMLNIKSITDYVISENYNMEDLINNYITFNNLLDKLNKFRRFSEDKFNQLEQYDKIIKPIYEYGIIEKQASYRPDKISFEFVNNKVKKGDLRSAIADIIIKIDYEITKQIKDEDDKNLDLYDKINIIEKKKIISKEQADILHEIRMFRNKLLHPTNSQIDFNIDKINEWNNFVFKSEVK